MRERRQYNESFRQQALRKVYTRGSRSVKVVAEDLNMSHGDIEGRKSYPLRGLRGGAGGEDQQGQAEENGRFDGYNPEVVGNAAMITEGALI